MWQQFALAVAVSTAVAWLSRVLEPGPWNLLVLLAPPIMIACLANKAVAARATMSLLLTLAFVPVLISNELVAHLAFGTCLYD